MQLGPELIFECPNCLKQYARGSIISGNTFSGTFYSDGRFFAMMLPQFPQLIRCEACKTAFWLTEETLVDQIEWNDPFFERREKIANAEFLLLDDYLDLLSRHFYQNTVEEIFLRTELWRCYNDRTRAQKKTLEFTKRKASVEGKYCKTYHIASTKGRNRQLYAC